MLTKYSDFFATIYDETKPVGNFGCGTHYSILRSIHWIPTPMFHDIAVIWDEDHDTRVIWVLEQLLVEKLLDNNTIAIGERKGELTLITREDPSSGLAKEIDRISGAIPFDCFSAQVETLTNASGVNDSEVRLRAYLSNIDILWGLGHKLVTFSRVM